jgi:glycosyltransferase involved in cell wall biosynthesis
MIYIDVTSAAASAVNMGVQRTVRGLYSHLKKTHDITPVRWDFFHKCYSRLSPREQNYLDHPFASYEGATATPGLWDLPFFFKSRIDAWTRKNRTIKHEKILRDGNLLLIPDLCWDSRIHSWSKMTAYRGRKIAIFHDAMPLRIPGQADSHDSLFKEYVEALAHLDGVICISQEVKEDLLHYWKESGLEAKPIEVIVWPVPFAEARPVNSPNQAARKIIYVSRLKLRKNHLVLLKACASLWEKGEKFSLDLIGIEDAFSDTRKILNAVKKLAALGYPIQWRKHISNDELTQAYRECAFTAFPSRLEGFGLPIIESLWHGRPVICGRNGAIGEVSVGGGCYHIDQNNPDELAEAIQLLLNDAAVYNRLYEETRHRTFRSWDDYGKDLDLVLQGKSIPAR